MRRDVHSCNVRDEFLISIFIGLKNKALFAFVVRRTKMLGTVEKAQLKWHVEPGKSGSRIKLYARKVMNSVPATINERENGIQAKLCSIIDLKCTPGDES